MILQGNYSDNTKDLIQSFDEDINKKNAELEQAEASLAQAQLDLTDADKALGILGVTVDA